MIFLINSALLGVGLAMDAFSVSIANGLREPKMAAGRMCMIAGVYAFFQYLMPMAGWMLVHTIVEAFSAFEKFIPWIALFLLLYLGGKMILEGMRDRSAPDIRKENRTGTGRSLSVGELLLQGIATSIDALSVGFTIAEYRLYEAAAASVIIAAVTFVICMGGLSAGKKAGMHLSWKACLLGGGILILIGIEVFTRGVM